MTLRLLLLAPTTTYRVADFLDAAGRLPASVEIIVGTERRSALESLSGGALATIDFEHPERAAEAIEAIAAERPLDAVVSVDAGAGLAAALATSRLGLRGNDPDAVTRTSDKLLTRQRLAEAKVPGPAFVAIPEGVEPAKAAQTIEAAIGLPCVVKPRGLSGSRGVIRADTPQALQDAVARIGAILSSLPAKSRAQDRHRGLIAEAYMPGEEVAVEGLMFDGDLEVLAIFDKPDPLEGPFFEETLYVTPSRHPVALQKAIGAAVAEAAWALGLSEGPIHAEVRLTPDGPRVLEVAARSIGGLCSRALVFSTGGTLESRILSSALGLESSLELRQNPAGVMMIPIPGTGILLGVDDTEARQVPGIEDIVITHPRTTLVPLPEGASYLGFIFATAEDPEGVEAALRQAHGRLVFDIVPKEDAPSSVR